MDHDTLSDVLRNVRLRGALYFNVNGTHFGAVGAGPEPATWAMMLLGFGALGFQMRRQRKVLIRQVA